VLSANPAVCSIFGRLRSEIVGHNVSSLMPPPFALLHDGWLVNYMRGRRGKRVVDRIQRTFGLHKNGSIFPMALTVKQISGGLAKARFMGVITTEIMAPNEHFLLVNKSSGKIIKCTSGCYALLGLSRHDTTDETVSLRQVLPKLDVNELLQQEVGASGTHDVETGGTSRSGQSFNAAVSLSSWRLHTGTMLVIKLTVRQPRPASPRTTVQVNLVAAATVAAVSSQGGSVSIVTTGHEQQTSVEVDDGRVFTVAEEQFSDIAEDNEEEDNDEDRGVSEHDQDRRSDASYASRGAQAYKHSVGTGRAIGVPASPGQPHSRGPSFDRTPTTTGVNGTYAELSPTPESKLTPVNMTNLRGSVGSRYRNRGSGGNHDKEDGKSAQGASVAGGRSVASSQYTSTCSSADLESVLMFCKLMI